MQHRQLVIEPPAQKSHAQHQWRVDPHQRLFEVGAGLLLDPVLPLRGYPRQVFRRNGVEIADQRGRFRPGIQRQPRSAVGGDADRRKC